MPVTTLVFSEETFKFRRIAGLNVDHRGVIYVSEFPTNSIYEIVLKDNGTYNATKLPISTVVQNPRGVLPDGKGNLYIAQRNLITKYSLSDNTHSDSVISEASLISYPKLWPFLMALDPITEELYFTERHRSAVINKITKDGTLQRIGKSDKGHKDGTYEESQFEVPDGIVINSKQEIFVSDAGNHCIRKISNGMVTTIAGQPHMHGYKDGLSLQALFANPTGLALDDEENLIIADWRNRRIRKLNFRTGCVSTLAGNGIKATIDGPFLESSLDVTQAPFLVAYHQGCVLATDNRSSNVSCNIRKLQGRFLKNAVLIRPGISWKIIRLLWIGKMKNGDECLLSSLPRELIRCILEHMV